MITEYRAIKQVSENNRPSFDRIALHPLQSWAWGKFRELLGQRVVRLGRFALRIGGFEGKKLIETAQFSVHRIPHTPLTVGYLPRGGIPSQEMVDAIREEARKHGCIFVKLEPNIVIGTKDEGRRLKGMRQSLITNHQSLSSLGLRPGKPLFTPYTFHIDLRKSEQELLASMKPKTRYNIRVAEKHGVEVVEDDSDEAFEAFQRLTDETTKRQRFFAHDRRYRQLMWQTMRDAGIAHLLMARLPSSPSTIHYPLSTILCAWLLFLFNGIAYYPYGASSDQHREVMASNLLAWRALQLAKAAGCHTFDFWGALGSDPDPNDPWYGFHRFKEGYGGKLVEFVGTWDLVINPSLYWLYGFVDRVRWWILRKK